MTELLPCPFCGGEAILVGFPGCKFVQCKKCKASTDDRSEDRAIAAWNRRANNWRPIETAPKDGTAVLLFASRRGAPGSGACCGAWHWNQWRIYGLANGQPEAEKTAENQWLDEVEPTHWQPLPAPPKETPND